MKPIILVPLLALALAASSAGGYFLLTGDGSVEEGVIAQATPTPTSAPTAEPTPTPAPTETPTPALQTYRNEKYGYEVSLPEGWRVANQYLQKFAELISNPRFTAVPEDYVVLTTLSQPEEEQFIEQASQEVGPALSPWYKFALGKSVQILPTETPLDIFLMSSEPLALRVNTNVREETLNSGQRVTRLTRREADDRGDFTYDTVYIAFTLDDCPPFGQPCQGIIIRIVKTPDYDDEEFETIFRSFRDE